MLCGVPLCRKEIEMQKLLTVPQASKLLETPKTNIYMLVRRGVLTSQSESGNPIMISESQLRWYLNMRLPSSFTAVYKSEAARQAIMKN